MKNSVLSTELIFNLYRYMEDNNPWEIKSVESFICLRCPGCMKDFSLKHNLHVDTVYEERKTYLCPHCESSFESNNNSIKIIKKLKT